MRWTATRDRRHPARLRDQRLRFGGVLICAPSSRHGRRGGVPQWNCGCRVCTLARAGDARVRARTQTSLAVSADGERWVLVDASPDLRQQLAATPALHPRGLRHSPITDVVVTGCRDRPDRGPPRPARGARLHPPCARGALDALARNPIFEALPADRVPRRALGLGVLSPRSPA